MGGVGAELIGRRVCEVELPDGGGGFCSRTLLSSVLCVVCVCEGRRSRDLHGSKKTRARYGFGLRILSSRTR
jgi:hypothetical protein